MPFLTPRNGGVGGLVTLLNEENEKDYSCSIMPDEPQ